MAIIKDAQWYLCEIDKCPEDERERLKPSDNLSVKYPDIFMSGLLSLLSEDYISENSEGSGSWFVWLPIIPRVGDVLQMTGWQVQVSSVLLMTDFRSKNGLKKGLHLSAKISIREDKVSELARLGSSVEKTDFSAARDWETFARRGHDLQFFAWELHHERYLDDRYKDYPSYRMWRTRIRPVAGDIIEVTGEKWQVKGVELTSANDNCDGILYLEDDLTVV